MKSLNSPPNSARSANPAQSTNPARSANPERIPFTSPGLSCAKRAYPGFERQTSSLQNAYKFKNPVALLAALSASLLLTFGCAQTETEPTEDTAKHQDPLIKTLETKVLPLISDHKVAGVGIALIDEDEVAWTGYFGQRTAEKGIDAQTMFNTGSVAKTVTAETVLRLVEDGRLSLDEPIADHWSEPDLVDDDRYGLLTPRIILSHRTGLLNWSYAYPDGKLAFVAEPGEKLTYSGVGYEMLVNFVQTKLGEDFETLARQYVYEPMDLVQISLSRQDWIDPFITDPMDSEGVYHKPYTYPGIAWVKPKGYLDGADDLYVSINDYAKFMIQSMAAKGLSPELASERVQVISDARNEHGWTCSLPVEQCPDPYGYGLGWTVFQFKDETGNRTFIQHGGTDFGEHAMAYYIPESRSGVVIFVNGGNGPALVLDLLDLLEENHPLSRHFRALYNKLKSGEST